MRGRHGLVTLGVGTLLGFVNGAVITAFNVHPFIITLGTMAVYRGIAFVQTGGQSIGGFPASFRQFVRWEILPDLSLVPLIVMTIVAIIGGTILSQTVIGRQFYAVGGSEIAARNSGIRVGRVKLLAYTISGLATGVAAVVSLGYYGAGSSGDGQGYELNAIAAAVVGGISLVGGQRNRASRSLEKASRSYVRWAGPEDIHHQLRARTLCLHWILVARLVLSLGSAITTFRNNVTLGH